MYLKRYHDVDISASGVWRILKKLDMSRLPTSQRYQRHAKRWKRYEKPLPGHRVQVDVKFIEPIAGLKKRHYQYTAIDDCTRVRVLRIYPKNDQKTAIQFLDYLLERLPFKVEVIQTDNGSDFRGPFTTTSSIRALATSTSNPRRHGSTARWREATASTTRSSTASSKVW